jgi:hypothetical protein
MPALAPDTRRGRPPVDTARIRRTLGRLRDLDNVTVIRELANTEAKAARRIGDDGRVAYCLAVAREAESILEVAICQEEAPSSGITAS